MPSTYKTYTRSTHTGPYRVKTWSNKICEVCKRFITTKKPKQKLCDECYQKRHAIQQDNEHFERIEPVQYYGMQTLRELIEFPFPQDFKSYLRNYL